MQQLDLASADQKVFSDLQSLLDEVRTIVSANPKHIDEGIRILAKLRSKSYENLNQIQHEYATFLGAQWLAEHDRSLHSAYWSWNPRQTGDSTEPDLQVASNGKVLISAEVTTSVKPQGKIDERMRSTLDKLSEMEGRLIYFVLSKEMKQRAETKIRKSRYAIEVVNLQN